MTIGESDEVKTLLTFRSKLPEFALWTGKLSCWQGNKSSLEGMSLIRDL